MILIANHKYIISSYIPSEIYFINIIKLDRKGKIIKKRSNYFILYSGSNVFDIFTGGFFLLV